MPSKPTLVITDQVMAKIRDCHAAGLTKTQTAAKLGYSLSSLIKAQKKASPDARQEIAGLWTIGGHRERQDKPAPIQWLRKPWRAPA